MRSKARGPLRRAVSGTRRALLAVGLFSGGVNLLMLAVPLYMLQLFDRVLATRSIETLFLLTAMTLAAVLALAGLEAVRGRIMVRLGCWLERELAGPVLGGGVQAALAAGCGGGTAQGLRDLAAVRNFVAGPGLFPLLDAPWVPAFLAVVFLMHPLLGAIAAAGAALLFGLALLNDLATRGPLREANTNAAGALNAADAAVRNADAIAAMGLLSDLARRWREERGEAALAPQQQASDRATLITAMAKFVRLALQVALLGTGAWLVTRGAITGGVMIAASIIMARAVAPVEQAITAWRGLVGARTSFHRIRDLLERAPAQGAHMSLPRPEGRLTVEAVTYLPPGGREPVLKSIGFALEPGQAMGLIGPSAAGKTTLARLLVGSLAPSRGHVRLGGADVATRDAVDRGRHFGYLPQDVELFEGTVRDNIARLAAEAPDEAVVEAARLAGVHDLILRLPRGYNTRIGGGEGAVPLSAGQRQRIALARAVFGMPSLVVLDEPNSNLDADGERALLATVRALRASGSTVVLIAHRLSVLAEVDKVLVLRDGAVETFGGREEAFAKLTPRPAAVRNLPQRRQAAPGAAEA